MKKSKLIALIVAGQILCGCNWIIKNQPQDKSNQSTTTGTKTPTGNDNENEDENENGKSTVKLSQGVCVDGHYLVDMGEAGEWATCNVGATLPEEDGDLFAWGETKPKEDYTWQNYKWVNTEASTLTDNGANSRVYFTRYNYNWTPFDGHYYLLMADDAATVNWGKEYCTPTHLDWKKLFETCSPRYIRYKESAGFGIPAIDGMLFTAKNGNTLFVPCSRSKYYGEMSPRGFGEYWTSALANGVEMEYEVNGETHQIRYHDIEAFKMYFTEDMADCTSSDRRYVGMAVRPVRALKHDSSAGQYNHLSEPEPQKPILIVN